MTTLKEIFNYQDNIRKKATKLGLTNIRVVDLDPGDITNLTLLVDSEKSTSSIASNQLAAFIMLNLKCQTAVLETGSKIQKQNSAKLNNKKSLELLFNTSDFFHIKFKKVDPYINSMDYLNTMNNAPDAPDGSEEPDKSNDESDKSNNVLGQGQRALGEKRKKTTTQKPNKKSKP